MDIITLLAAFAGGAFGALLGGIPVFVLTGFAVIVGAGVAMAGAADLLVGQVGFGMFLSPHTTFVGACAAIAYAARIKKADAGGNIFASVSDSASILVGGIFGVVGQLCLYIFGTVLALPTDNIALSVFVALIIARLFIGKSGLFGTYENGEDKEYCPKGEAASYSLISGAMIGLLIGCMVSIVDKVAGPEAAGMIPILGWGLSAFSLIYLQIGASIPASHHITISSGLAAVAFLGTGGVMVPIVALVMGAFASFVNDSIARIVNTNVDSHIDPPAGAIAICTTIVLLFL